MTNHEPDAHEPATGATPAPPAPLPAAAPPPAGAETRGGTPTDATVPTADGAAATATDAPTDRVRRMLLVLTCALAALSLVLGGLLVVDAIEMNRLRREASKPAVTVTVGSPTGAQPTGAQTGATKPGTDRIPTQPTTGQQADLLKSLQRRQAGDPLALGKPDAPVILIEWADYRCPFCAKWSRETLPKLKPYIDSGSLRVEFRDLVIFGDDSQLVHQAVRAAGAQGKYFEYASLVWAKHTGQGHPDYTDADLEAYARQLGLDVAKFNADRNAAETKASVTAETTAGSKLGITGTPFFVVNTTPVSGALPTETFIQLIEDSGGKK